MSGRRPPSKRVKTERATLPVEPDMETSDRENEMEALLALENGGTDAKPKVFVGKPEPDSSVWCRAPYARLDPKKDALEIMQVDASQATFAHKDGSAIINLYGLTKEGASVLLHVEHFHHYFYVPVIHNDVSAQDLRDALEAHLGKANANHANNRTRTQSTTVNMVHGVQVVKKKSIMNYIPGDAEVNFYKITLHHPRLLRMARDVFRNGGLRVKKEGVDGLFRLSEITTFEATLDYVLRFMIEVDLRGCAWLTLAPNRYTLKPQANMSSHVQIEATCQANDIIAHKPEGPWLRTAPMRRLSFDIECAGRKGIFPDAEFDSVIQIANYIVDHGNPKPAAKVVFTLDSCAPIVGAKIYSYKDEGDMLAAWSKFVRESDPDVLTGYNIVNFDLPYLIDRAEKLKVTEFPFLGRLKGQRTAMKKTKMSSSAFGTHESRATNKREDA